MLHWTQQLWIDPCQSRKRSSVDPIIIAPALPDQSHATRVHHDRFMTELRSDASELYRTGDRNAFTVDKPVA
jgi:hypothetical protein